MVANVRQAARTASMLALLTGLMPVHAGAEDAGRGDAGVTLQPSGVPTPADPRLAELQALYEGKLSVDVAPQSLFDVPLGDEAALQVEATRLRALLSEVARDAGAHVEPPAPDSELWHARLALDRARLQFYALSRARRSELLADHAARRTAARPREAEAERREREVEAERRRALEAAETARGEAERLIAEELARVIAVEGALSRAHDDQEHAQAQLRTQREALLGWQRRVRDAKASGPSAADEAYTSIRTSLRADRAELASALDALAAGTSKLPALPADALSELPSGPKLEEVRARRRRLAQALADARRAEHALLMERAAVLVDVVAALNRERLGLLPYLSAARRDAVTGFTSAGWDQAGAEARHLGLILRYQRHVTSELIAAWRKGGPSGPSIWRVTVVAVPWLALVMGFVWARRRSSALLRLIDLRLSALDRAERRIAPSPQRRAVRFLGQVHVPLEWGALLGASLWLLPASARALLEVRLLSTILFWMIGMALLINGINALSAGGALWREEDRALGALRLRSLRLLGRIVLVFALILLVSERLVGEGTIHSWVVSAGWLAAAPVLVVLVRWWRAPIFERVERTHKRTPLHTWQLAHREGWSSYLAAALAALELAGASVLKLARRWLSGFDLARRAHAYLFRRELERLGEAPFAAARWPLAAPTLQALDPEARFDPWLSCPADTLLADLATRSAQRAGGLVALIGARGMGKSTLGAALIARTPGAVSLRCAASTTLAEIRQARTADTPLVLLDDAQALAKPMIGGLALFDAVTALAREHCRDTLWVWLIDAALWPLLKRARDARPLFDETHLLAPWNEQQIGSLIEDRCARARIAPIYDDLLEKPHASADELDRLDALHAKKVGYERMLWDHVRGNPALALEAWRTSLAHDDAGVVHVRPLQLPEVTQLESLPDSTLFVLRAVLQLGPAATEDVANATGLSAEQVSSALRYGESLGFFCVHEGRVVVSWSWLRAVMRLLERRHLLVVA